MTEHNHYLVDDRYLPEHVAEVGRLKDFLLIEEAKVRNLQAENQRLRQKLHAKPDECTLTSVCWTEAHDAWEAELEQVKAEAAAMRQAIEAAQDESYRLEGTCIGCGAAQGHEDNCPVEQALSSEAGKALQAELVRAKERIAELEAEAERLQEDLSHVSEGGRL